MKAPSIADTHKFCEICGADMAKNTELEPPRYNRLTGALRPRAAVRVWWECPSFTVGSEHDREPFV